MNAETGVSFRELIGLRDDCYAFTSDPGEDNLIRSRANTFSSGVDNCIDWSPRILRNRAVQYER